MRYARSAASAASAIAEADARREGIAIGLRMAQEVLLFRRTNATKQRPTRADLAYVEALDDAAAEVVMSLKAFTKREREDKPMGAITRR